MLERYEWVNMVVLMQEKTTVHEITYGNLQDLIHDQHSWSNAMTTMAGYTIPVWTMTSLWAKSDFAGQYYIYIQVWIIRSSVVLIIMTALILPVT